MLKNQRIGFFVLDAFLLRAQTLVAQGQARSAQAALQEALPHAEALGSRRTLWRILALLGDQETHQGNPEAAHARYRAAREHISYIADHIHLPILRDTFLTSPPVSALLDAT